MKAIICCACGNVANHSKIQFKIAHPDEPIPETYVSRKGYSFLEMLPPNTPAYQFVQFVLKKRGRYSFLIDYEEDGALNSAYDYIRNKRAR